MTFHISIESELLQWSGIAEITIPGLDTSPNPLTLSENEKLFYEALPLAEPFTTSNAEEVALQFRVKRARLFRMMSDKKLFRQVRWGVYQRID